jgi:glutamine synthetase type III
MATLLGARGGVDIPAEDRRNVYEHLARHYREFDEEPPEYHAQTVTSRGHESDILKEKIKGVEKEMGEESQKPELKETPETVNANVNVDANVEERLKLLEAENAVLKAKIADLEEQRRLSKIAEVLQVREEAGLCVDREAEVKKLRNFSDEVLEQMKEDAERVASLAAANRTPKAKYTAEQMHRRIEEVREALLGYRKSGGGR